MNTRKIYGWVGVMLFYIVFANTSFGQETNDFSNVPVKGRVTMVDLGAKKCVPCKMMAPILEKLEKQYKDKADIVFIDVWKNKDQADRFRVHAIPTQIFYDVKGMEVYRHVGFMAEKDIKTQFEKMGVD